MSWKTTEPPQINRGDAIVALGRIISHDEYSTFVDPFCAQIFWLDEPNIAVGWHYHHGGMSVARNRGDEVRIDAWLEAPVFGALKEAAVE